MCTTTTVQSSRAPPSPCTTADTCSLEASTQKCFYVKSVTPDTAAIVTSAKVSMLKCYHIEADHKYQTHFKCNYRRFEAGVRTV